MLNARTDFSNCLCSEGFVGMTEYERRSEKAHKELEDYLEHERSLKRQNSHEGS